MASPNERSGVVRTAQAFGGTGRFSWIGNEAKSWIYSLLARWVSSIGFNMRIDRQEIDVEKQLRI